ncbi:hypothetical protein PIB30_092649 [Stylosanthes scabra]|uniref:Uncharacterized protein n=1 Tax=Stylosanthes scabra TaxID=79078 RepID=A0ABU6WWS6_9FABA|nr:hypothetical protein [Stylosanthes scabra]
MKKGSLQSKKQSLGAKQSKNPTHMHGRARICVLHQAWKSTHMQSKATLSRLGVATKPILSTHRRRSPRICVVGHQAHVPSHVYTTSNVTFTSPSFTHPRIGVEDPCICVESTLAASNVTRPTPKSFMRGSKLHKTHA